MSTSPAGARCRSWIWISTCSPTSAAFLVGICVSVGVVFPWANGRWLLVLDWVNGPGGTLPPAIFGLSSSTASAPSLLLAHFLIRVIGGPATTVLVPALVFPLASWAAARLFCVMRPDRSHVGAIAAGLLYCCNPFVFERVGAGQVYFLLGYALLPLLARALLDSQLAATASTRRIALWLAALTACSVHFLWIGLVLGGARVIVRRDTSALKVLAGFAGAAFLSAYLVLPQIFGQYQDVKVSTGDLAAYRSAADPVMGLYVNILGMYGFWRRGPVLPKDYLPGWPLLLVALLLVVGVGFLSAWRSPRRRSIVLLAVGAVCSYFLALGTRGPTGSIFAFFYYHLPGFNVMREPEKFSANLLLFYSVAFGQGVAALSMKKPTGDRTAAVTGGFACLLVLVYTPTIFDGLGGQLRTSAYPIAWYTANRLMGDGPGQVLTLPWHEYESFPFTQGRIIANPASTFFSRRVISGDDVEIGELKSDSTSMQSAYLEDLFAQGPKLTEFGHLVAQLGVSYVLLDHNTDYLGYSWLAKQDDLKEIFSSQSLTVWQNTAALPAGSRVTSQVTVGSVGEYIALAEGVDLRGAAVFVGHEAPASTPWGPITPVGKVRRRSTTEYSVREGPGSAVVVPEDFNPGWASAEGHGRSVVDGVTVVPVTARAGTIRFHTWSAVELGYSLSGLGTSVLLGTLLFRRLRRRRRSPVDAGSGQVSADVI